MRLSLVVRRNDRFNSWSHWFVEIFLSLSLWRRWWLLLWPKTTTRSVELKANEVEKRNTIEKLDSYLANKSTKKCFAKDFQRCKDFGIFVALCVSEEFHYLWHCKSTSWEIQRVWEMENELNLVFIYLLEKRRKRYINYALRRREETELILNGNSSLNPELSQSTVKPK